MQKLEIKILNGSNLIACESCRGLYFFRLAEDGFFAYLSGSIFEYLLYAVGGVESIIVLNCKMY